MPTIHNVRLEIVENHGAAAALVTYRLAFNSLDLGEPLKFFETVQLIGVDTIAGEDGQDDLIPGGRSDTKVTLSFTVPERRRLIALQGTSLDEDKDAPGPAISSVRPDEIRARVTLTPPQGLPVTAVSDPPLVLHRISSGNNSLSSA
ncbi:MAG TPA: hypothetical protein VF605_07745 [Allosphingosinicella sp.]|jgi:hypothetical protein